MTEEITGRDALVRFLERLLAIPGMTVYAPVAEGDGAVFDRISSVSEALLDFPGAVRSPRHILTPMTEKLLSMGPDGRVEEAIPTPGPAVLFGVRPCDARAIAFLDRVYAGGDMTDPYYRARRDALTIVSLGCREPRPTCFCTTTGGGPLSPEGSDIMLEPSGKGWSVRAVSEKGRVLADATGIAVESDGGNPDAGSIGAETAPRVDIAVLKKVLDESFDDPRWQTLTAKCLGCGACSFICPSCHCFDIVDGEEDGVTVRSRIWDTCQFKAFTKQASGHDPRPTGADRFRHRMMHKFSYCIDSYGMPGCVGCGRCVEACPVNLDIRRLMEAFGGDGLE